MGFNGWRIGMDWHGMDYGLHDGWDEIPREWNWGAGCMGRDGWIGVRSERVWWRCIVMGCGWMNWWIHWFFTRICYTPDLRSLAYLLALKLADIWLELDTYLAAMKFEMEFYLIYLAIFHFLGVNNWHLHSYSFKLGGRYNIFAALLSDNSPSWLVWAFRNEKDERPN